MFNIFKCRKKSIVTILNSENETHSPFSIYAEDEVMITDKVKPTSMGEYIFLMGVETFYTEIEEEILKIVGSVGVITSRQITQLMQEKFSGISQAEVQYRLKKLRRKNFLATAHLYSNSKLSKSSFAVVMLGYHGRKTLADMDMLPSNSLYFRQTPAFKVKNTLGATQFLLNNGLWKYLTQRSTLLNNGKNIYLRVEGLLDYKNDTYIVESVRRTVTDNGEYKHRAKALQHILEDYTSFGLNKRPKLLVIAESSQEISNIRKYTKKLEQLTEFIYGFDTANLENIDKNVFERTA